MSYHSQSFLCTHDTYFMHMHAIGAAEEITLVELGADPQEENQEAQHQEALGEGYIVLSWNITWWCWTIGDQVESYMLGVVTYSDSVYVI